MLELATALTEDALAALADLEQRSVAADGGRLKLEWEVLRGRSGERVEDLLWWDGQRLAGYLGLYEFGAPDVELAGVVAPTYRRRGIGNELLDTALTLCRDRGYRRALLVTPHGAAAGAAFACARGACWEHSEHALVLTEPPPAGPPDPAVTLRAATAADRAALDRVLIETFGRPLGVMDARDGVQQLVIELGARVIGTVRVTRSGEQAGVYGFAVERSVRGRGIGRDVLRRVCAQAFADGARRIGLEVAVDNERALGLYTSLGFAAWAGEDYYALPLTG